MKRTEVQKTKSKRKKLKKKAERDTGRPAEWRDGVLCCKETGQVLQGYKEVPKAEPVEKNRYGRNSYYRY